MSSIKTDISWLHFSDFHLREKVKWSQDVVLKSLLEDVQERHSGTKSPDLLFITGDVAFSGKSEEYVLAEEFIHKLQAATSIPADKLFIIPGNHDINRTLEEDAFRGAHVTLKDPVEVDKFFANEGRRKTLFSREEAFRTFVNKVAPPDKGGYSPTSFAHSKQFTIGPINVRVLLLDSAWMCEGGDADTGTLLVGERQVIETPTDSHALNFGLIHHPFAWLRQFEQIPIENLLLDRVHLILRGHVHSADMRSIEALERRLTFFTAGAAYETRTSDNSYSSCNVDLATGLGTIVVHKYIHASKRWEPNAPQTWSIIKSVPAVPLEDAVRFSEGAGGKYPYYHAALLAGHSTEIPRITNHKPMFLNFEVELPGDDNTLGRTILKLRNHFFWRKIWDTESWALEATKLAEQIGNYLRTFEGTASEIQKFLNEQEERCRQNAQAIIGYIQPVESTPVFEELAELKRLEKWTRILEVVDRWSSQKDMLTKKQQREFERIEIESLLALNRVRDAITKMFLILESDDVQAADFHLAASCYYLDKDYPSANKYIHKAIDRNIELSVVRRLALMIAGQTGDSNLTKRVM